MANLHLVGKGETKTKQWKVFASALLVVLCLILLGFKWYEYIHSPIYAVEAFIKASMNGDIDTINHLNYTNKHEQTIKQTYVDKLKNYSMKDLVFTQSDAIQNRYHITSPKDPNLDLMVDVTYMGNSYFITHTSP